MENLCDVKEIKRLLNKAYGKNATPEDRRLAKLIMFSTYGLFGATLPHVPRETMEKGDDKMEQRKFKVGDKVRIVDFAEKFNGKIGEIKCFDGSGWRPYQVLIQGENNPNWLDSREIELVEEEEMRPMFKLEMGKHVVETRNGSRYLLVKQEGCTIVGLNLDVSTSYAILILDENLQDVEDDNFDIKRVYKYRNCGFSNIKENLSEPVWEREEVKEMTMKEICDALGCEVKIKKED